MPTAKMVKELTEQLKNEWESEYLYMAMMAWCYNKNYDGFAQWFEKQAIEEHGHGVKFVNFIKDVDAELTILSIKVPPIKAKKVVDLFKQTLKHEQEVTARINQLVALAHKEHDFNTLEFLQWFVMEQREEESTVRGILAQFEHNHDAPGGMFLIEQHLAQRA
jgi:ferritin